MPEAPVLDKPAPTAAAPEPAFKPPQYPEGDMSFGHDKPKTDAPAPTGDRPRDDHGRFAKPAVEPTPEPEKAPDGGDAPSTPEPEKPEDAKASETPVPQAGLDLDDEAAPTFGFDGKFQGGKFLGKYETLDDALQGHKHALKRIGQLEHELSEARSGAPATAPPPYVYDPHSMTEDQLAAHVAREVGEMSIEERIAYEENPGPVIAKIMLKAQRAIAKVTETTQAWDAATKQAYPALYERARPLGAQVWADFKAGKVGPAELQVLIGAGIMARDGKLSDDQPVTRNKPAGRALEARAVVPVKPAAPNPNAEADEYEKRMRRASYG